MSEYRRKQYGQALRPIIYQFPGHFPINVNSKGGSVQESLFQHSGCTFYCFRASTTLAITYVEGRSGHTIRGDLKACLACLARARQGQGQRQGCVAGASIVASCRGGVECWVGLCSTSRVFFQLKGVIRVRYSRSICTLSIRTDGWPEASRPIGRDNCTTASWISDKMID